MADFTVSVTKNGVIPAVIFGGNEQTYGQTILFQFSSDWNTLTKEVIFFSMRGDPVIVGLADGVEINIPQEISAYGGDAKYTIRGFTLDSDNYISDALQVTGTLHYTYTAGNNTRLIGKLTPNTLDLFLATANQYILNSLAAAKASGEFDGADGANGQDGADGTPAGFGTPTAMAYALSPNAQPTVSVFASGDDTAKVFAFEFGIPGSVVEELRILGHYASLSALQAAVPNPSAGDTYSVGSSTPYNIYVFDGTTGTWANYGTIGGGGSGVTVDTAMSASSTNAVQNGVIKAYVDDSVSARQAQHIALALTLDAEDWSNSSQTVTASGVTSNSTVIVSPAPSGISAYTSCGVYCSAQSANSLTFVCAETPDSDIAVNVVVLGGD